MYYLKEQLATSHIDKHNEKISLAALKSLVERINTHYIPMGVEHDPRIPPIGRLISAEIEELQDGEFAAIGISERFEDGDEIEFRDDKRELPIREITDGRLHISYDRSYRNSMDQQLLEQLSALVNGELDLQLKKAVEPISILIIASSFVAGSIASGFLSKIGEDTWDLFKEKLNNLLNRKRIKSEDHLLLFEFIVSEGNRPLCLQTILTNPSKSEINLFLEDGLRELDEMAPKHLDSNQHLRKVVLEYENGQLRIKFGVRKDAVPLSLDNLEE